MYPRAGRLWVGGFCILFLLGAVAASLLIAFPLYALQVVFSNWWMSRFRFGPMEWLWRTLTYGKPPAMTAPTG